MYFLVHFYKCVTNIVTTGKKVDVCIKKRIRKVNEIIDVNYKTFWKDSTV